MAEAVMMSRASSLNPLRCTGTALPPPVLMAAKMIVLGLLLKGYIPRIPGIFVPMWPVLDKLPGPEVVRLLMQGTVGVCGVLLLCNRAVRTCALLIGLTFIFGTLASRGFYSNGRLFCSAMLILIGLYGGPRGIWPLRWQFVLLYFGTGLNKITQADWRSGWYFENWMHRILEHDVYATVASWFPPMSLSWFMCWATILTEFSIAVLLAVPRWHRAGIWLALFFHLSSVAITLMSFGIFVIAVSFSLLVFVEWPAAGELRLGSGPGLVGRLIALARRLDFDGVIRTAPLEATAGRFTVQRGERTYTGLAAAKLAALSLPVTYYGLALGYILPSLILRWTGTTV